MMLWFSPVRALAISPETLINLTNQQRQAAGLQPLNESPALDASATAKAQDMLARDYWAHFAPDGTTPWSFMSQAGYQYRHAGENLAMDFSTDDDVMTGWMNSPTHRANVLGDYRDVGIAVVQGTLLGEQTTLVVAHYGTPLNESQPAPAASPAVASPAPIAAAPATATATPQPAPVAATSHATRVTHRATTSQTAKKQHRSVFTILQFGLFQTSLAPLFKYQG